MSSIGYDASVKSTFGYNDLKELVMDSTYNRGELRLNSKGKLETVNSHVTMTWQNHEVTSREENARVRSAIYKFIVGYMAETNHSGDANAIQKFLDAVRESLFADGVAGESLSRDEVRFLLLRATDPKKFADIPLTSRKIRAVKLAEDDYGKNQVERERFLKDNIKGYNVSAKKNDVVLRLTDNKQSDKAWRQALAEAKANAARMLDTCAWLSEPAKVALRNHIDLELEEVWSQAKSLEELNATLGGNTVNMRVRKAVHNAHSIEVLNAVTEFAKEHPVAYGQLRSSGIDLLTAVGPRMTEVKEYLGYLAHGMRGLIVPPKTTYPRLLCNKLLERAGKRGKDVLNGADPSTMTRSQLLETCVELLKVQSVDEYFEDIAPLTAERVLKAGEPLKDGHEDWVKEALDSNEGKRFLNVLSEGAIAFGMGQTPTRVANLLRKMVNAFPEAVDGETRIAEMKAALADLTTALSDPKSNGELSSFMNDSGILGNVVKCFKILTRDKFRVTTDLAAMKTFLSGQFGENWRQIEDLSIYMDELETQANTRPPIGSDYLQSFRLDAEVGRTELYDATGEGKQIQAPVLKFKLEQLKQVILSLGGVPSARQVADALRIVKGKNLPPAEKEILQTASGKALLESLDRYEVDGGSLRALSYPEQLAADKEAQLKRILLPLASKAFQDGRLIENLADLRKAWDTAFGKPQKSSDGYLLFKTWMSSYLSFLTDADEWKQIGDPCADFGIDPTALHLSEVIKTNSNLLGPFLQEVLSSGRLQAVAAKGQDKLVMALNNAIEQINYLKPEDLGLEVAGEEDRQLFDNLKCMMPLDCLDLANPASPLENRQLVRIFKELTTTITDQAKANVPAGDQQAIAGFRKQLVENLLNASSLRALFLKVRQQRAEAADPLKAEKFTVAGWLKKELDNLKAKQKELEGIVVDIEKDYGHLLSEKDAQKLRTDLLSTVGINKKEAILDPSRNFKWDGKVDLINRAISLLQRRKNILAYTVNLADQPAHVQHRDLVLAVARIVAMSQKTAFIDSSGVDKVLDALLRWTQKPLVKELSRQLSERLAGMPNTKADVLRTLESIFAAIASELVSLLSGDNVTAIFGADRGLGPDDALALSSAVFCEMLNVDQELIKNVAAAKANVALDEGIDDVLERLKGDHLPRPAQWYNVVIQQGITLAVKTLGDWVAKHGSGGGQVGNVGQGEVIGHD